MFTSHQRGALIRSLSGGEKRRLYLIRLLMERPNVLLLDEPTNNLDIDTLNVLESYIEEFPGAVITVSHDRYFLDKITDKLLVFEGSGVIREYFGTAEEYFLKSQEKQRDQKEEKKVEAQTNENQKETVTKVKTKLSYMEEKEWSSIEDEITTLEGKIEELDAGIIKAGSDFVKIDELFREKSALQEKLDGKYERWEYLAQFV